MSAACSAVLRVLRCCRSAGEPCRAATHAHPLPPPPAPAPPLAPRSDAPEWLKKVQKLPYTERIAAECLQAFLAPTKRTGSLDIEGASGYLY